MLKSLTHLFSSRKTQSRRIAKVCAVALKEMGLHVGGNVFQLTNSKGKTGWLISLLVPQGFSINPTDSLALRIYLSRQIETTLGMKPKSLGLVLSFNNEAKKLPISESVVDSKWIRSRIPVWLERVPKTPRQTTGPSSLPPVTVTASIPPSSITGVVPLPEILRPSARSIGAPPKSLPAKEQEDRLEKLLASMPDDEHYEVHEASMTDFDRALT